jgi:hypothetical protein
LLAYAYAGSNPALPTTSLVFLTSGFESLPHESQLLWKIGVLFVDAGSGGMLDLSFHATQQASATEASY